MEIQITSTDNAKLVALRGRLDSSTAPELEKQLFAHIDGATSPRLAVSFAELDYISSAGLRVLLMAAKKVRAAQGKLALCEMSAQIREVFDISGFLSILTVVDSRDNALAAVRA